VGYAIRWVIHGPGDVVGVSSVKASEMLAVEGTVVADAHRADQLAGQAVRVGPGR